MHPRSWISRAPLLAALGLASLAAPAYADGMRCGTKLVVDGDSLFRVRSTCGDPDSATSRRELRAVRRWVQTPCFQRNGTVTCGYVEEQAVEVIIHEWIYDFGPHEFVRHLTFEQEKLLRIETGGYGVKQT